MTGVATRRSGSAARLPIRDLIGCLLSDDVEGATSLTQRVLEETNSRTAVFADLLHPAQAEIGDRWYSGRISVADEVRVAATVRLIVGRLAPTPVARPVVRGSRCILAVPRHDPHDLGLMMLMLAMQDHGWSTDVLAPVVGLDDLVEVVVSRRPRLFGLSAGRVPPLQQIERTISAIKRAGIPVLVGGVGFNRRPDLWRRLGADGLGTDVRVGVVLAQRLCGR